MEVEVKLRLPDAAAHQHLSDALASRHLRTHLQDNLFFDSPSGDLSARLAVLRLRFYDGDARCVLSLKARARISGGVSRVEEDEEDLDPALARSCVAEPWRLGPLAASSRIMKRVKDEFGVGGDGVSFTCLGGFRNVRAVYQWEEGLVLELDETQFSFGTSYELECETADPERAKVLLEAFLKKNAIPYTYSEASKFAVFRAGKLPPEPSTLASAPFLPPTSKNPPPMEVEVKLHLPDAASHQRLSDALAPRHLRTHLQENLFFDSAAGDLSACFAVLRIRFYDGDTRCVLSLKARACLVGGVSRVEEDEEDLDPIVGRTYVAEPWRLGPLAASSRIMKRVKDEFGVGGEGASFACLGGFRNVRAVYQWEEGLVLELDETQFSFGTSYELECETADPERVKGLLEGFLKENGIPYSYSKASKFAVFRAGKLLPE